MVVGGPTLSTSAPIADGNVTVGVRLEDVRISAAGDGLPFRLNYVEELGALRFLHGQAGDELLTIVVSREVELAESARVAAAPAKLHFFSPDTGRRIGV